MILGPGKVPNSTRDDQLRRQRECQPCSPKQAMRSGNVNDATAIDLLPRTHSLPQDIFSKRF